MVVAVIVGVFAVATIFVEKRIQNTQHATIKAFIEENPALIAKTLTNYSQQAQAEAHAQALNLIKAHDGKTIIGNPDGDVKIYEFSDYNCGYCKRNFAELMEVVKRDGNIRLVIKEFPILSESSVMAARYALAAAELGAFEEFHSALMTHSGRINENVLNDLIAKLGLDLNTITAELAKGEIDQIIANNHNAAGAMRIQGTPAFIIGETLIPGLISKSQLQDLITQARRGDKTS